MAEHVFNPLYWKNRLTLAIDREQVHHAFFVCDEGKWRAIAAKHRKILARQLNPTHSVLDIGCGWGRLLSLMPEWWKGHYFGVDLSPDFIAIARNTHKDHDFMTRDIQLPLKGLPQLGIDMFDWCIMISIRPMIRREIGGATWDLIEKNIREVVRQILYLEYDENDEGSVE